MIKRAMVGTEAPAPSPKTVEQGASQNERGTQPLEELLSRGRPAEQPATEAGLVLGAITQCNDDATTVGYRIGGKEYEEVASMLVAVNRDDIGRQVVLGFLNNETTSPLVVGFLQSTSVPNPKRLVLGAEEEIVLQCGDAAIRIDAKGAIEVNGKSITSFAEGVHRVQGGSVQIN